MTVPQGIGHFHGQLAPVRLRETTMFIVVGADRSQVLQQPPIELLGRQQAIGDVGHRRGALIGARQRPAQRGLAGAEVTGQQQDRRMSRQACG